MSDPAQRRATIRALLAESDIQSQAALLAVLEKRGLSASQPVLSRDLRALNVAKQGGYYRVPDEERITPLAALKSLLRAVEPVTHFLLVECEPGAASAVARALDAEELEGLVGTIAGDDTVLVATNSNAAGQRVRRRVRELL
jgi:transcriptional regulator of arginine metabolism